MYGLPFLSFVDADLAREQAAAARTDLARSAVVGLTGVREYPEGAPGFADVDSGPIVMGFGAAASGLALAAFAASGDTELAQALVKSAAAVGDPEWRGQALTYQLMHPLGQAVLLFGKTFVP